MSQRLESLRSLIAQDPANSRFRYMLAIELTNSGDGEGAVQAFRDLIETDPNYSAAYFHCAQALEKLGRLDDARATYRQGIDVTSGNGDQHTRSELQAALDMLG